MVYPHDDLCRGASHERHAVGVAGHCFLVFLGLVFVCFIDFDKGKKEAGRVDSGGVVVAASGVGSSVPGAVVTADGDAASEIQVEAVSM